MTERFVVVGGGLAGARTARELRNKGFTGEIDLVCAEEIPPYERPPLSKDYLAGAVTSEEFLVQPREWYAEHGVRLRLGTRASAVYPTSHRVELADGTVLDYDRLVLATGSRPRRLPLPGADARGVHCLRRLGDADRLRETLRRIRRLVVIGAGWIGLEVAAVARNQGVQVCVVENAPTPLAAALGPRMGEVFADLHREHGVDLRLSNRVSEIHSRGGVTGVRTVDGADIPADAVLVAVGARPEIALAADAGLDVGEGVLVDTGMTTSDPDILAVGDIAETRHPVLGRIRVEHWANALKQPRVAAATMLGEAAAHTEVPYFFTDQYDLGMEYHGRVPDGVEDRVLVRGNLSSRRFVAFWLDGDNRVWAGMNVNVFDVSRSVRALVESGQPVDPRRLVDTTHPLEELAASHERNVNPV
ncbi:NAD(P)/FAD-dependent oxidoreductase [Actinopolyspora mortivallis]|uniref:FAD-dependent oxidoreductase n=1 Tax=Actinopolyspora mortivallis TaxID=33906 RepID=A0A2T0GRL5_ACTMO|nr:FAD-dependent oxidoreductase [Actinopolyspora mortivallis]PRW61693.1 FAD-dependent oxidoreductase [Actinopolyspora mortivallis]